VAPALFGEVMTEELELLSSKVEENRAFQLKKLPPNAGKGRPLGSLNKVTRTIRDGVLQAYEELGGAAWLVKIAEDDPRAFIALLSRSIPPASKDPEEIEGLADATARARERLKSQREAEIQNLSSLSDEELGTRIGECLSSPATSGELLRAVRRALSPHDLTLEELLEMSHHMEVPSGDPNRPNSQEEEPPRRPLDLPYLPAQTYRPEPAPQPRPEPLPARDGLSQKQQEQLPGQAPGSHLRQVTEYPSPSVGTSISDAYDPLA